MVTQINTKRILIFLAFAFGIPWAAALAISQTSVMENNPVQAVTLANYIFISTPALANVATRLITREGWGHLWLRPNFRRGWRFYLAVWLLPLLAVIVGGTIFYLLFPQSFDPNLGEVRKLIASSPSAAANPWMGMLFITIQVMILAVPINSVLSIGEEFGWRAYLLPKLMERFAGAERASASAEDPAYGGGLNAAGARKAALLVGVVHGVWHWPLFFLGAVYGFPYPNLLLYLIFTCSLSVLLSWGTLRSGSVWPASVGHGAVNATAGLAGYLLKGPANLLLGPLPTGLIGGMGYIILALVLLFNRRAFVEEKEAVTERAPAVTGRVSA
jgi:membrane protease YdiL (CAAX protease family)